MKTLRCELYCAPFQVFALPVGKTANIPATVFEASVPSFFKGHSVSIGSVYGVSFARLSNRRLPNLFIIRGSRECKLNSFWKTLPWQLLSPYVLPDFTSSLASPYVHVPHESRLRYNNNASYVEFSQDLDPTKIFQHENFLTKISIVIRVHSSYISPDSHVGRSDEHLQVARVSNLAFCCSQLLPVCAFNFKWRSDSPQLC